MPKNLLEASEGPRVLAFSSGLRCLTPEITPFDRKGLSQSVPHASNAGVSGRGSFTDDLPDAVTTARDAARFFGPDDTLHPSVIGARHPYEVRS